ncbi:hypothetical protein AN476_07530 [Phaeobacter sp. 11ANDIMAR09]|nr:hypothetical protein AN476_07530 [Phaeobacter sp. 11ANDIMAR09]
MQRENLPSREQIVAAIYETVLRPQLFDRFSSQQQMDSFSSAKRISAGARPVFEAPELQAHFARALDILEHQWNEMGRPSPAAICADPVVPGWESNTTKESDFWVLLSPAGEVLQQPRAWSRAGAEQSIVARESLAWLAQARGPTGDWRAFVDRIEAQNFSWQDILVLETSLPNKRFLCRPIWQGGAAGAPVAISVELMEVAWPLTASAFIAKTFGLDTQEVELLRTAVLGISPEVGRGQGLGSIAARAGAPGAAELVRLVGFLLQEHANDLAIAQGQVLPPSAMICDRTGRETQYFRLGADTGQPVIFVHGMMDGIAGVQHLQPLLRNRGFRVYAPLRGGYGASAPPPTEHQQIDAFVAQVDALIEQENLQKPLLLGHRSGVIFARAAALRLRGRIGGLVGAAATPPLKQTRDYRSLHRFHRALALCARFAPPLVPMVLKGWYRSIQRQGASALVQSQARPGSWGWRQIHQMELDALLSLSLSLMMEQGGKGVLTDLKLTSKDWRDQMIGHAGKSIYLCGSEDALARQKGLYPQALGAERVQFRISTGAGDVLLYVCPELVLEALEDLSLTQNPEIRRVC